MFESTVFGRLRKLHRPYGGIRKILERYLTPYFSSASAGVCRYGGGLIRHHGEVRRGLLR